MIFNARPIGGGSDAASPGRQSGRQAREERERGREEKGDACQPGYDISAAPHLLALPPTDSTRQRERCADCLDWFEVGRGAK